MIPFGATRIELPFKARKVEVLDEARNVIRELPVAVENGSTVILPDPDAVSCRVIREGGSTTAAETLGWLRLP